MGTPEFAVASLQKLVESGAHVVAVVTMPDKPIGRHHDTLQASPVKQYALSQNIPVLQPERLKDEAFLEQLRSYHADLQVVVAFRMLPEVVWAMPPMGTFNLHAALLPQYRGAAPINWAIINGDTVTGVTTFFLDHDIDTGRIIHREEEPIADTDTIGDLYDRLMVRGADLVVRTVADIAAGRTDAVAQDELLAASAAEGNLVLHAAPKIFKDTCRIPWHRLTVKSAYDFIRGLSPVPASWTLLCTPDGKQTPLKIFFAEKILDEPADSQPLNPSSSASAAAVATSSPAAVALSDVSAPAESELTPVPLFIDRQSASTPSLLVPLAGGHLRITDLQLAGKRRMPASDFLRGARLDDAYLL